MRPKFFFLIALFLAAKVYPIGRIGNHHVGDPVELYKTQIPPQFSSIVPLDGGGLILESGLFSGAPARALEMTMFSFKKEFPYLREWSQDQIVTYFLTSKKSNFKRLQVTNGALNMLGESDSSYVGFSLCTQGRGFIVYGPKSDLVYAGIYQLLTATQFEVACWN